MERPIGPELPYDREPDRTCITIARLHCTLFSSQEGAPPSTSRNDWTGVALAE